MLAWKFATGTCTFGRQRGELCLHPIERAALALAPQRVRALAEVMPVARNGKLPGSCHGGGIGCERVHLLGSDGDAHVSFLLPHSSLRGISLSRVRFQVPLTDHYSRTVMSMWQSGMLPPID